VDTLQNFLDDADYADEAERLGIPARLEVALQKLETVKQRDYLKSLVGTLGADPLKPLRAGAEQNVIAWNKAKLAQGDEEEMAEAVASLHPYRNPSFIQRVKSRFKRVRLN
jgi:hypothetical protein